MPDDLETVCGLPIVGADDMGMPLAAFVVVKSLDEDDGVSYLVRATEGLSTVECLGMAELAVLRLKEGLRERD